MERWVMVSIVVSFFSFPYWVSGAEKGSYPPPRFPSYLKPPKSVEEIMPYARAAVRQTGGRTPLGLVEKGQTVLLGATDHVAETMVLEAIKRAYTERGVKAIVLKEHELR